MQTINIGITGTGSLIGQAIIKSIKSSDIVNQVEIIGFDYFENTIGSFWCRKNIILPDILKKENKEQWKKTIFKTIIDEKISILFIGVDFELMLFSQLKSEIEETTGCKVVVSNERVISIGNDKYLTYKFLKDNGLNFPKTWLQMEIDKAEIKYPCIIKPRVGARSKGVYVIKNKNELKEKIKSIEEPIVQELVGNIDSEYTCGILCLDNKIINTIVLKRYLKEGNTSIAEYKNSYNDKIYDYINKIAMNLMPNGSCNLQLRCDTNGEPYLFEINPRFSGTTYMRALFGFKEVEYTIKYLQKMEPRDFVLSEGKAYRYFEEKLMGEE